MRVSNHRGRGRQRGFVLIGTALCMLFLLGVIGIGFDIGRMYIAHNESQVFTDAAALTAAQQLNGTHSGIGRARAAALAVPMKWNLGTRPFEGVVVEFSTDGKNWESDPVSPSSIMLARVTAPQNNLEIVFFRALGGPSNFLVPAHSIAAVQPLRIIE